MTTVNLAEDLEEDFERDIEAMLREQQQQQQQQSGASFDRERELNIYRSGSAPPTVEGSRNAIRSMFDGQNNGDVLLEEEMRSHPAYMSYYYLNENLNPRLPPPLLSKEDWRAAKRFDFGGIGDRGGRKQLVDGDGSSRSLFSMQPGLSEPAEHNGVGDWVSEGSNGLTGLTDICLGSRRKSFTDALQDDFNLSATVPCHIPRPFSQNTFENASSSFVLPDVQQTQLCNDIDSVDNFCSRRTPPGLVRVQSLGSSLSRSFASAVDPSLTRSRTPGPQLNGRSSNPCLPSVGSSVFDADTKMLSSGFGRISSEVTDYGDMEAALASLSLSKNRGGALACCSESVGRPGTRPGSEFLGELVDPSYVPYLQSTSSPAPISGNLNDPSVGKGFFGTSDVDLLGYQKAYIEKILEQQKLQYGGLSKVGLNNGLYGPAALGVGMPYPLTPVSGAFLSSMGPGNHLRQSGRLSRFPTMLRSAIGASKGSWDRENGIMEEEEFTSSLLAEFKNNKTRSFELSDIVDHVVEFRYFGKFFNTSQIL
ncbi:Pumilio like 4 [Dendrobium catenatum]|uniref:Pumilio like 4 n=1 Tax=Dendrobium catenatum TaxID=906689 RepID=A0A2I0VQB5_9ASPA|nr:Pumilio like 4 [Dendrobium catenatum]